MTPELFAHMNPFRIETLDFDKITWLSQESIHSFHSQATHISSVAEDLSFTPYELKSEKAKRFFFASFRKPIKSNLAKLQKVIKILQEPPAAPVRVDPYLDYQLAASQLRQDFKLAVNDTPTRQGEVLAMTASSAAMSPEETKKSELPLLTTHFDVTRSEKTLDIDNVNTKSGGAVATDQGAARKLAAEQDSLNAKTESNNEEFLAAAKSVAMMPKLNSQKVTTHAQITGMPSSPLTGNLPEGDLSSSKSIDAQVSLLTKPSVDTTQSKKLPGDEATHAVGEVLAVTTSSELSVADQKKLTDQLLHFQLMNQNAKVNAMLASKVAPPSHHAPAAKVALPADPVVNEPSLPEENPISTSQNNGKTGENSNGCSLLSGHEFIRPINSGTGQTDREICPTEKRWISKERGNAGWVRVQAENHLPTVTLHPAPNQGSTLLIDQNALALIALKSGLQITKGMGMILGKSPAGYKVEFAGRAEETEYFETNGNSYFAIINVEPGAGIVELESKTNPNLNSTVFAPILEDAVTYLDLVAPIQQNLPIQVVKSGAENASEVSGLTVGLSTQSGIQAITQSSGQALLKNVNLVPGYPVFIDVSSKNSSGAKLYLPL